MKTLHRDESGLTLIELMIVVLIIGVLAGVIAVNLNGVVTNAKINSLKGNLSSLQTASDTFATNKDGKFPTAAGGAGAVVGTSTDANAKAFVGSYVHAMPSTKCADWGVTCVGATTDGTWEVNANGKAFFKSTDGTTTRYWYLPDQVSAAGTATAP